MKVIENIQSFGNAMATVRYDEETLVALVERRGILYVICKDEDVKTEMMLRYNQDIMIDVDQIYEIVIDDEFPGLLIYLDEETPDDVNDIVSFVIGNQNGCSPRDCEWLSLPEPELIMVPNLSEAMLAVQRQKNLAMFSSTPWQLPRNI